MTEKPVLSSPSISSDGTVLVGSDDGNLYAIDSQTGFEKWRFRSSGRIRSSPVVLVEDGSVLLCCQDGSIYAISSLGEERWTINIGQTIRTSPAIEEGGRIYLGADDGCLYAIA